MAKDREKACDFYKNEGNCSKGHRGTFRDYCQTCKDYRPRKGSVPCKKNLRKEKHMKYMNDMRNFV